LKNLILDSSYQDSLFHGMEELNGCHVCWEGESSADDFTGEIIDAQEAHRIGLVTGCPLMLMTATKDMHGNGCQRAIALGIQRSIYEGMDMTWNRIATGG